MPCVNTWRGIIGPLAQQLVGISQRLYEDHADEVGDVAAGDLELIALRELQGAADALISWRIGVARRIYGFTTEHIAHDLGYTAGSSLRRRFPDAGAVEAALRFGMPSMEVGNFEVPLEDRVDGSEGSSTPSVAPDAAGGSQ